MIEGDGGYLLAFRLSQQQKDVHGGNGPFQVTGAEPSTMPRKQVLGRKHKSGTGNNKDVPSTRKKDHLEDQGDDDARVALR